MHTFDALNVLREDMDLESTQFWLQEPIVVPVQNNWVTQAPKTVHTGCFCARYNCLVDGRCMRASAGFADICHINSRDYEVLPNNKKRKKCYNVLYHVIFKTGKIFVELNFRGHLKWEKTLLHVTSLKSVVKKIRLLLGQDRTT